MFTNRSRVRLRLHAGPWVAGLCVAGLYVAAASSASAQRRWPALSIEAGASSSTLITREETVSRESIRANTGWGFDAGGRLSFRFASLGLGFRQSGYSTQEDSARTTMRGVVLSPRIAVPGSERVHPYIEGELGRLGETTHGLTPFGPARFDDRVRLFGGRLGLTARITPALSLDLSASYSDLSFHDFTVDDVPIDGTKLDEHSADVRLGVSYRVRWR